jgi:hypothetical protein
MFDWIKNNLPSVNIPDIANVGKTLLRSAVDSGIDKILPKDSSPFISSPIPADSKVETVSNFATSPSTHLTDADKFTSYKKYITDKIATYTNNLKADLSGRDTTKTIGGDYLLLQAIGVSQVVLDPLKDYLYAELVIWNDWDKRTNQGTNPRPSNFSDITMRNTQNKTAIDSYSATLENEVINVLKNKSTNTKYIEARNNISAVTIVNMDTVRYKSKVEHDKLLEQNAVYDAEDINFKGMLKLSGKTLYILGIVYYAFVISFAIMVSIFVANDLLHKRPAFRVFAFFITFFNCLKPTTGPILLLIGIIYFIKRRITYANGKGNAQDRLLFLSLIPCYEVSPDEYDNINSFWKFLNTYTLGEKGSPIHTIVENNKISYNEAREKCLESTEILQNSLLMSRNI